jgi:hypothetical protein
LSANFVFSFNSLNILYIHQYFFTMKKVSLLILGILASVTGVFAQASLLTAPNVPDPYGYYWRGDTTASGPVYSWVDITTTGTQVSGLTDDNVVGPINLGGMTFKYYWNNYTSLYIGSNGYISFANNNVASAATIGFPATPSQDGTNDIIAAFLTDLKHDGANNQAKVFTYADVQNQKFIITFQQVPFWTNNTAGFTGSNTFQIILDAKTGNITYQYDTQTGNWNSSYNTSTNSVVIGIENSTGVYGRMIANKIKPTPPRAFTFYAPAVAGISVIDGTASHIQNVDNGGIFVKNNTPVNLAANIKNAGNVTTANAIGATATVTENDAPTILYTNSQSVPAGLVAGAEQLTNFGLYTPSTTGGAIFPFPVSHKYAVQTDLTGDMVPGNDINYIEMAICDVDADGLTRMNYTTTTTSNGLVAWSGGSGTSGGAVYIKPYAYPAIIKAVEVVIRVNTTSGTYTGAPGTPVYDLSIYDDTAVPGAPLGTINVLSDSLQLGANGWTWARHYLPQPIVVTQGGVFVSWIQRDSTLGMGTQDSIPVARRCYEILDGSWAVYRQNNVEDMMLGLAADMANAVADTTDSPLAIAPVKSGISTFTLYPNPSKGVFNVEATFSRMQEATVKVVDMQGAKVHLEFLRHTDNFQRTLDLSYLPQGIYFVQIITPTGMQTKKVVIE